MALGICRQWPHLHHLETGGTGCLGLSGVAGLSGTGCLSGVGGWVGRFGWMSWEPDEEGPAISLTFKHIMGEPCTFTMGPPSLSSSGTNWLWINSRLPIPLERTLMASLRAVSSSKFCIRFLKRKKYSEVYYKYRTFHKYIFHNYSTSARWIRDGTGRVGYNQSRIQQMRTE